MVAGFAHALRQLENALWMVKKSEFSDFILRLRFLRNRQYDSPTRKEFLARSASCSSPNGATKGDLEFNVAAMVSAGSKHRKMVDISKNLPRWTSVGSLLNSLPIGVISSEIVNARTLKKKSKQKDSGNSITYLNQHRHGSLYIDGYWRIQCTRENFLYWRT